MPWFVKIERGIIEKAAFDRHVPAHVTYVKSLIADGHQARTGYWAERGGGMLIFEAANLAAARAIVQAAPLLAHGCVEYELHEWCIVVELEKDMADSSDGYKILSDNRQARFQYEILETFEAGLELKGTEVKSIRAGKANLRDGFAQVRGNEAWLHNVHISPHNTTIQQYNHDPRRVRKLLLHKGEIRKLIGQVEQKGLTLVPLKIYLTRGWVKVTIALAKGKKLHDKRDSLKRKQEKREVERALKSRD